MTIYYVRSTTGSSGNDGLSWATAKAKLIEASALAAAGDSIYLSQVHSEVSTGATLIFTLAGTLTNPVKVFGVDDATDLPLAGNIVAVSGAFGLRVIGHAYFEKVNFTTGSTGTASSASLFLNYSGAARQVYKSCDLFIHDTHTASVLNVGSTVNNDISDTLLDSCRLKLSHTGQSIAMHWLARIVGGSIASGGSTPTAGLFGSNATWTNTHATIENFDMSVLSAGVHLLNVPPSGNEAGLFEFINCKLPASWSGSLVAATFTNVNWRASLVNCSAGDVHYTGWKESNIGYCKNDTTFVKTSGSTLATVAVSLKMETRSTANEVVSVLRSNPILCWNDTEGAEKVLTVDLLRDSVTDLTDADIWAEVDFLGTAGGTLGVRATNRRANVLTAATAHASSAAAWSSGMTNPNEQKLVLSCTPQEKGYYSYTLCLGKPSSVVYADLIVQES